MTRRSDPVPFAVRLAVARGPIARGASPLAVHEVDQLDAASRGTRLLHDRLGALLPIVAPDRPWRQQLDMSPSTARRAHLLASVLGCPTVCCHLRKGAAQPAFVTLALRRIDCPRCIAVIRRPPPDEADRCDVCGARAITTFVPFAGRHGPALVVGDACRACAGILGILEAAS
jgi:hypothetical protein